MMRCWSRDITDRPSFHRLYQALRTFAPHSWPIPALLKQPGAELLNKFSDCLPAREVERKRNSHNVASSEHQKSNGERSRGDEISQKAFIHSFTRSYIHLHWDSKSFFPIHRHLRFFLYFSLLIFPFSTIILLFFIINVISVCCFPRRTVTIKPTVYSSQKEPTGRMSYLSKLWSCIVEHCCLWLLFHFCPIFVPYLPPHWS